MFKPEVVQQVRDAVHDGQLSFAMNRDFKWKPLGEDRPKTPPYRSAYEYEHVPPKAIRDKYPDLFVYHPRAIQPDDLVSLPSPVLNSPNRKRKLADANQTELPLSDDTGSSTSGVSSMSDSPTNSYHQDLTTTDNQEVDDWNSENWDNDKEEDQSKPSPSKRVRFSSSSPYRGDQVHLFCRAKKQVHYSLPPEGERLLTIDTLPKKMIINKKPLKNFNPDSDQFADAD